MAPPKRFARDGEAPRVANMGSMSVVLLAAQKPVWVGSLAEGLVVRAWIVWDAACGVVSWMGRGKVSWGKWEDVILVVRGWRDGG